MLKENPEEEIGDEADLKQFVRELAEAQKALKKREGAKDPAAAQSRGALARRKGFVHKLKDSSDAVGTLIGTLAGGVETAGKILDFYNHAAPSCGMPQVPNPFATSEQSK